MTSKHYDLGQKLTKDKKAACEATKVTSTTPPKGAKMEVDDAVPEKDLEKDESQGGAQPKKAKKGQPVKKSKQ